MELWFSREINVISANEICITFNHVHGLIMDRIKNLNDLSKEQYIDLLKLVNEFVKSASNLCSEFYKTETHKSCNKNPILCLLGKDFYNGKLFTILQYLIFRMFV